jgi:phosphoribosylglycinamide formyltransferase-1
VEQICLALRETTTRRHGSHAAFLVRKKTFAYYLDYHHGDGIVAITCKVAPGDNLLLAKAQPDGFYLPAYLASREGAHSV